MSIKRGEIYFVNLNPIKGKEQSGIRPVLVLSILKCKKRTPVIFLNKKKVSQKLTGDEFLPVIKTF